MILATAALPLARITRVPRTWLAVGAWCALGVAMAAAARAQGAVHGADHVLLSTFGAYVLPLLAYGLVGSILASRSLRAAAAPAVAFGAPPAPAAAVVAGVATLASALTGGALAALLAILAHGVADPPLAHDALVSAYAGALGGAAYGAWFALGSAFGKQGGGRAALLVVDWILGATSGAGALVTPRGHLRNLLGGAAPMDLSQRASAVALVLLALACVALASRRARA